MVYSRPVELAEFRNGRPTENNNKGVIGLVKSTIPTVPFASFSAAVAAHPAMCRFSSLSFHVSRFVYLLIHKNGGGVTNRFFHLRDASSSIPAGTGVSLRQFRVFRWGESTLPPNRNKTFLYKSEQSPGRFAPINRLWDPECQMRPDAESHPSV